MNNTERYIKKIYKKSYYQNLFCAGVLLLVIVVLGILMMTLGNTNYSLLEVIKVLGSKDTSGAAYTIKTLRLPKLIVGGLAGFSFGIAGHTFQSLLRNPLASPDIIGVTSGSSAAAVFCILILGISGPFVSVFSIAAGLLITAMIFVLSGRGNAFGTKMILIGIGMQAALNALISWMLLVGSEYDVGTALRWLRGSLNSVTVSDIPMILVTTIICGGLLIICNRYLRIMQLGDEYATALGAPLNLVRICCMVCALFLTAVATAATGPIASIAFLSGPIAVRLTRNGKNALIVAGFIGTILVYAAELASKNLFSTKYPVGVVTGILGAPYLLLLLLRLNKKGEKI
ncbi:FecCD family ABC transporter permease [Butyrivibrio sp. XBB1001]|uniref:FecCD family ABC transporter permease n=1 Tax=Butyrivibrio sp. XBB1001 TaxID=1280682 RepID=UPI0004264A6D|nr:iron ABC transporter permease [Butyrivibrio sp. XBB1001]